MGRVSEETIQKLNSFIESLPEEARNKCALCNETLTHIVKQAEAQTGAGTATVTRALAEKINESAAPQDTVTENQLRQRAMQYDGSKNRIICSNGTNNENPTTGQDSAISQPSTTQKKSGPHGMYYATQAILNLNRIAKGDPEKDLAFSRVRQWLDNHQ